MARPRRLRKLLVANRGEIAVRILRAARELGIATVAVHTREEREALHVELADEPCELDGTSLEETYLNADRLVAAARQHGADALHPGYGFLSESERLARACAAADLAFVGPPPAALTAAGDKLEAKRLAREAGVPVLEEHAGPLASLPGGAARLGLPLLVKAAGGGGGRGIRCVRRAEELEALSRQAAREAEAGFGDGQVYLERYLPRARHVEVQVLADAAGTVLPFPERECSLQRRHQKLVEESPAPGLTPELRSALLDAAVRVARAVGYRNAGTVEFLLELDGDGRPRGWFFLEVNARIQVEHPVTEAVSGVDLVAWQLRIAAGETLPASLHGEARGHAIECRLCAERPPAFTPATGLLAVFRPASGPWIRFDTGYRQGDRITTTFDSLVGKLIVSAPDRATALRRLELALAETTILGVETNVDFLADLIRHPRVQAGDLTTSLIADELAAWQPPAPPPGALAIARAALERQGAACPTAREAPPRGPWERLGGDWRGGGRA